MLELFRPCQSSGKMLYKPSEQKMLRKIDMCMLNGREKRVWRGSSINAAFKKMRGQ